jgi:hypothetical protein
MHVAVVPTALAAAAAAVLAGRGRVWLTGFAGALC